MRLIVKAVCDIGNVREVNEDMIMVGDEIFRNGFRTYKIEINRNSNPLIIAIADGMGGHKSGEYASETVLAEMSKAIKTIPGNLDFVKLKNNLKEIINSVHFILLDEGFKDPNKFKMGSTFVGLMLYNNKLYLINIGDSRFYRFREGILSQISRDHSLKDMTGIDDISKNIITNSFGGGENIFFDLDDITDRITSNDTIVICSDGLSNEIGDEDIEKLLSQSIDPIALVEASKNSGGNDNISIIIISINKDEFPLEKGEKN